MSPEGTGNQPGGIEKFTHAVEDEQAVHECVLADSAELFICVPVLLFLCRIGQHTIPVFLTGPVLCRPFLFCRFFRHIVRIFLRAFTRLACRISDQTEQGFKHIDRICFV